MEFSIKYLRCNSRQIAADIEEKLADQGDVICGRIIRIIDL